MKISPILCATVIFLAGCSSGKLTTTSGRPEIHVQATPKAALMRIVQWAPSVGQIVSRADTNLWFVTTIHKLDAYLNGSPLPSNVDATTTYTIVPMKDFVVIDEQRRISYSSVEKDQNGNLNSVHHYDEYTTQRAYDEMQAELVQIASTMK